MQTVTVTLVNRATMATVTVQRSKRHGACMCFLHQKLLEEYPNHYVKKSVVR